MARYKSKKSKSSKSVTKRKATINKKDVAKFAALLKGKRA